MIKPSKIDELWGNDVGGWIAPDGTFFQAEFSWHNDVARKIVDEYLHVEHHVYFGSEWLIENDWIRLETDGIIHHPFDPTGHQLDVLYALWLRAYDSCYKHEVYQHIKPIVQKVRSVREPRLRVPGQGDQENYQKRVYTWTD